MFFSAGLRYTYVAVYFYKKCQAFHGRRPPTLNKKTKQVAQLWQRDRAKLALFSINVQLYSQNHISALSATLWGIKGKISALSDVLTQRNFVAEFYRENISFIRKTAK